MSYSTGQIAELCGVTVRTVQFYDGKGLLKPDSISEGGRRIYGEQSLKTLQLICLYKQLGLSLAQITEVLSDGENSKKILLSVLNEREKTLDGEIKQKLMQRDGVRLIREQIAEGAALSRNSFLDVQTIMRGKKKQRATYAIMVVAGIVVDAVIAVTATLWGIKGWWLPFAIGMPCVLALIAGVVALAYRNLAYICTDCGKKFRPSFFRFLFSPHTPKTRKLTCPYCGANNFHTESFSD